MPGAISILISGDQSRSFRQGSAILDKASFERCDKRCGKLDVGQPLITESRVTLVV